MTHGGPVELSATTNDRHVLRSVDLYSTDIANGNFSPDVFLMHTNCYTDVKSQSIEEGQSWDAQRAYSACASMAKERQFRPSQELWTGKSILEPQEC